MAESKHPDAPSATTAVAAAGVCCLSGARAPEDVPILVRMRGADARDYLVSEACLDKYSRQLYVYGIAAMARMMNSSVLVSGLSGLGAEISKNIVLAGVKAFTVHDGRLAAHDDLASNFFLAEKDLGRNRAACCVAPLRELNKLTPVTLLESGPLTCTRDSLGQFTVVVLVDYARADIERIGAYCHANDIILLATGTYGLYGYCFADFGDNHKVSDPDGEPPSAGLVVGVERSKDGATTTIVRTDNKEMHGLDDGDSVVFTGVGGSGGGGDNAAGDDSGKSIMDAWCEALDGKCMTVRRVVDNVPSGRGDGSTREVTNRHAFAVDLDSASLPEYTGGAFYFTQRKNVQTVKHRAFSDALACPEETATAVYDYTDWERPRKLHAFLRALWDFGEAHDDRRVPSPGNVEEASKVVENAIALLVKEGVLGDPADEDADAAQKRKDTEALLMTIALGAAGQLNPMATIFGGLVGQEVMKACSGKYVPITQFFHFEDVHVLPRLWSEEEGPTLALEDVTCGGSTAPTRYDGLVATMGRDFLAKIQNARVFLVGSGALGCELLKNFAMSGVGTSEAVHGAGVTVTDMDTIENSNLCRQFLFREWDVGKEKSVAAARAANSMNGAFKPTALNIKVAPDTESKYNDAFWEQQTVIVNALDNVQARKYVDTRCTFYGKPLLESGTLGVKANVQPIIPHLTQCYNDVDDAPPKSIAVCTLKMFPYKVEHTIQWARDHFSKYFEKDPAEVNGYLSGKKTWVDGMRVQNTGYSSLQTVHSMLCGANGASGTGVITTFAECVAWARLLFENLFANTIKQLLAMYPADKMINLGTEEAPQMVKFWRGEKKVCSPVVFDASASDGSEDHMNFVVAAAHLCASIYGVSAAAGEDRSIDAIRAMVTQVSVPEFRVNKNQKMAVTEEEAKEQAKEGDAALGIDVDAEFARLSSDLADKDDKICKIIKKMSPEVFEKDDDTNHHMDFITACSNLRCHNYGIRDGSGQVGADKMKTRKIAGNIIPAIATTTALTTGAAMLELFKVVNGRSDIEAYRAYNFNLGINCFLGFEPTPCDTEMFCGKQFSVWSYIDVDDMTLGELLDWFEETYGKEIEAVNSGSMCLVNTMLYDDELIDARKEKRLSDLVEEVSGKAPEGKFFILQCYLDDDDDDDESDSEDDSDSDEEEPDSFMPQIRVRLVSSMAED